MDKLTRLIEIEAIHTLMARRVRCIDEKDWDGLEACYAKDAISYTFGDAAGTGEATVGAKAIVAKTAEVLTGLKTAHQVHMPEIEFQSETQATGIWPLNDVLAREHDGKRTWMRAYGHYRQSYQKFGDNWQITEHRLTRLLVENGTDDIVDGYK
jgi:hypothetical protein